MSNLVLQSQVPRYPSQIGGKLELVARQSFRDDALRAIEALGNSANMQVKSGTWLHIGQWLDWPEWLREGTSLDGSGPLPLYISSADDLLIAANVLGHSDPTDMLVNLVRQARPAMGPRAALLYTNAPTLGDSLEFMAGAINANNPCLSVTLNWVESELHFGIDARVPLGRMTNYIVLMSLILMYKVVQSLASDKVEMVTLETNVQRSESTSSLWPLFQCQVRTGAGENRLVIPTSLTSLRNPEADPTLWLLAQENFKAFERTRDSVPIVERVRARVVRMILEDGQVPRLKQVAVQEGVAGRTIIRLLTESSTSFHAIVEGERRLLAARLINDPSVSMESISMTLGFTDKSSFGRSFRKWFGSPPGEFRKIMMQGTGGSALG